MPAETPAPAKKPETPAERKPTKAERIEALRVSLHTVTKVGRPPAGKQAMTGAERVRRHRAKKADKP